MMAVTTENHFDSSLCFRGQFEYKPIKTIEKYILFEGKKKNLKREENHKRLFIECVINNCYMYTVFMNEYLVKEKLIIY